MKIWSHVVRRVPLKSRNRSKPWTTGAVLGFVLLAGWAQAVPASASELDSSAVTISVEIAPMVVVPEGLPETGASALFGTATGTLVLGAGLTVYFSARRRRRAAG